MFYDLPRKQKNKIAPVIFAGAYLLASFLFGMKTLIDAENKWQAVGHVLLDLWYIKAALAALIVYVMVYMLDSSLDIKAKRVGQGQHGSAAWLTDEEASGIYTRVAYRHETKPAVLVGQNQRGWLIDTSDNNMLLLAPPGGGKTKRIYIPSIYYNAQVNVRTGGHGPSMLVMDIKGELYNSCAPFLREAGYRTPVLNFREIIRSSHYNLMYKVNAAMDKFLATEDPGEQALFYGEAERHAKVLAGSLFDSVEISKSEASDYFNETAKGLITGIILLVAQYAEPEERHILSVFNLVIDLNGTTAGTSRLPVGLAPQKSRLEDLLEKIDNRRLKNYTGAATGADVKTLMNVFSSALSKLTKFIDAELEQIICDHSPDLADASFIDAPTAIFIICPDENTTRHFFASLFIRYFSNDLINQAETVYRGVLPRQVIYFIDEFGNLPPINDVDVLFSAIRSRGVRIIISLQSYAQLFKSYSKERAQIIQDTCQMVMSGFVAPSAEETAKKLSTMLGNETVLTGSISTGKGVNATQSMVGRPLMSPSDLVTLPHGTFIVQKGGQKPLKTALDLYFNYLKIPDMAGAEEARFTYTSIKIADPQTILVNAGWKENGASEDDDISEEKFL